MSSPPIPGNVRGTGPSLAGWIRAKRLEQGLSQRELAFRSHLSRSYVCDIERGRGAHPSVETLDRLAAALGFARIDLLKAAGVLEEASNPRESDEERRMLSVFRDLSDGGRSSVMRFARFVHADEHQWVQPNLLDGQAGSGAGDDRAQHPNGADRLTRSLFEPEDVQRSKA